MHPLATGADAAGLLIRASTGQTERGFTAATPGLGHDRFRPRFEPRQEIDQYLSRAGITVHVEMEFDNADSMIRAIQANRGIGIVPEAAVETGDCQWFLTGCSLP